VVAFFALGDLFGLGAQLGLGDQLGGDGRGEGKPSVGLVVGDRYVEGAEDSGELLVAGEVEDFAQVGYGIEYRQDLVGVVAGGPLGLEGLGRVGDGRLADA
jgi:hypothetical protein